MRWISIEVESTYLDSIHLVHHLQVHVDILDLLQSKQSNQHRTEVGYQGNYDVTTLKNRREAKYI